MAETVHCPFGCTLADCDEHGYCRHLAGFTNDGKTYEPVRPLLSAFSNQPTGKKFVDGRKPLKVEKGDRLVNPESAQVDQGAMHVKKEWVSSRVYRETPDDELEQLTRPEAQRS